MKLSLLLKFGVLVLSSLIMVGCKNAKDGEEDGMGTSGAGEYGNWMGSDLTPEEAENLRQTRVFYFPYDSSSLSQEDIRAVEAHAYYLVHHPQARIRIEGNTDSRGSREYNIALGERRAQAVARVMYLAGVQHEQVAVVSYGAEKPAVQGMNEDAWRYNRRVEIVYEAE